MTHTSSERAGEAGRTVEPRNDLYRLPDGRDRLHAHDIRHLTACAHCDGLADKRTATKHDGKFWHPRCAFEQLGSEFLLSLPPEQQGEITISDVDRATLRRLIDAHG